MTEVSREMHGGNGTSQDARKVRDIDWSEWRRILSRAKRRMKKHDGTITAASTAFHATLALIPGITALIIGYLLVTGGNLVKTWLSGPNAVVPDQVRDLLREQVDKILSASGPGLWVALALALGFSIFSARNGMVALVHGLNRAYGVDEKRSGAAYVLRTLFLAICASIFVFIMLALIVAGGTIISSLDLSGTLETVASAGRWIVLMFLVLFAISILYRYGPDRENPHYHFVTVGSLFATLIWACSSLVFAWYVETIGTYDKIYGTLGSIVILMIWFYISAWVILYGAEVRLRT